MNALYTRNPPERDALWRSWLWQWANNDPDLGPDETECHWAEEWGQIYNVNFTWQRQRPKTKQNVIGQRNGVRHGKGKDQTRWDLVYYVLLLLILYRWAPVTLNYWRRCTPVKPTMALEARRSWILSSLSSSYYFGFPRSHYPSYPSYIFSWLTE